MKILIIERFEGKYAICEDEEKAFFGIELNELPKSAKVGSVLILTEEGTLKVDEEETERRKRRIVDKQNRLYK